MKIEELTQEQIGKAKSLATDEERLDYLNECGVELNDDMLSEVAGGKGSLDEVLYCQKGPNKNKRHQFEKTGKKRKGKLWGLIDDVEVKCVYCGKTTWKSWKLF